MRKSKLMTVIGIGVVCVLTTYVYGWGNYVTHPAVTLDNINRSQLDAYLMNQLGRPEGIETGLNYDIPFSLQLRMQC